MTKKAGNLPHVKLLAMSTPAILLSFSFIEVIIIIILYYNHIARPVVDAIVFYQWLAELPLFPAREFQ